MYTRVIPRDFFNEAKLLKCMGLLALKILDRQTPVPIEIEETGEPFEIVLHDDGSLQVINYPVIINGRVPRFSTVYNSKDSYPFFVSTWDYEEIRVFTETGEFTEEFIEFCQAMETQE